MSCYAVSVIGNCNRWTVDGNLVVLTRGQGTLIILKLILDGPSPVTVKKKRKSHCLHVERVKSFETKMKINIQ